MQPPLTRRPTPQPARRTPLRPAFQADFAARLDWCVKPYAAANHPPTHDTRDGLRRVTVAPGTHVMLDGRGWTDPDGMGCRYQWSFAPEPSSYGGPIAIEDPAAAITSVVVPQVTERQRIHVVLTVRDRGDPPLVGYQRWSITVDRAHG